MGMRAWTAGLVLCALVLTPAAESPGLQPTHATETTVAALSFLQTSTQTGSMRGPGTSFVIPSIGALIGATFVMVLACISVAALDDFGMQSGCAIISTVLFCVTVITIFMFYEGNMWFFREIVDLNIMMEVEGNNDPTLEEMQSRLSSTSTVAFVVSLLYALVNYRCLVPSGETTCVVKKRKMSFFYLPMFVLFI